MDYEVDSDEEWEEEEPGESLSHSEGVSFVQHRYPNIVIIYMQKVLYRRLHLNF